MRIIGFVLMSYVLILLPGCEAGGESDRERDIESIETMSESRAEAFNNEDAAAIAGYFTEDGLLMPPESSTQKGRDAVEAYYQGLFDRYEMKLKSHYEEVEVSGDLAYGRGVAEVEMTGDGGDTTTAVSTYINILKRQPDGSWKTTHDIWNSEE